MKKSIRSKLLFVTLLILSLPLFIFLYLHGFFLPYSCQTLAKKAEYQKSGKRLLIKDCTKEKVLVDGKAHTFISYSDTSARWGHECGFFIDCVNGTALFSGRQLLAHIEPKPGVLNDYVTRFYYGCPNLINSDTRELYKDVTLTVIDNQYYWVNDYNGFEVDNAFSTCVLSGRVLTGPERILSDLNVTYKNSLNSCDEILEQSEIATTADTVTQMIDAQSNEYSYNECLVQWAQVKNDVTFCEQITDGRNSHHYRYCIEWLAAYHDRPELCVRLGENGKESCESIAKNTKQIIILSE